MKILSVCRPRLRIPDDVACGGETPRDLIEAGGEPHIDALLAAPGWVRR